MQHPPSLVGLPATLLQLQIDAALCRQLIDGLPSTTHNGSAGVGWDHQLLLVGEVSLSQRVSAFSAIRDCARNELLHSGLGGADSRLCADEVQDLGREG